jgi:DNA-binding response OmpR family regulator
VTTPPRVIVVAQNAELAGAVAHALRDSDCQVVAVADFGAARAVLERQTPDLLISEVKLGAYNGLHLAIVARGSRAPTHAILIGPPDPVIEAEARRQDAVYLTTPASNQMVIEAATRILSDPKRPTVH